MRGHGVKLEAGQTRCPAERRSGSERGNASRQLQQHRALRGRGGAARSEPSMAQVARTVPARWSRQGAGVTAVSSRCAPRQGNAGSCVPDGDAATISLEHTKDRRSGIWLGGRGLLAGEFGVRTSSIACKQAPATGAARRPPRAHQGAPLQSYMTIQRRNSFRAGGTPRRLRPAPNNPASFGRPDASLFASARS